MQQGWLYIAMTKRVSSPLSLSLSHTHTQVIAMFSKLTTFRSSKAISSQRERQRNYNRFNSQQLHATESDTSQLNISYSSKPPLIEETVSETSDKLVFPHSDASPIAMHVSDDNSSLDSVRIFSTYDSKDSMTSSSRSEEIDVGPSTLLPYEDAEEDFLEDHEGYFVNLSVNNVRKDQYNHLELQRIVYLDYATCPIYSRFQVEKHMQFLLEDTESFLGSNSSFHQQSPQQNRYADSTYKHILDLLNTTQDDYSIIFTSGLSSCYRLLGDMYDLQKGSLLLASHDHHKSVLPMIHAAAQCNAKIRGIPMRNKDLCIHGSDMHKLLRKQGWSGHGCGLLVYPAQSFLTGMCHSLTWTAGAQQNGWKVLLDVSSCLPMVKVDLSSYHPEFVIGSLHHILGYPSSVGFLLVQRSSHSICLKKGSAQLKLAELPENGKFVHVATEGEDLHIHTFAALSFGLEHLQSVGYEAIQKRVMCLTAWLIKTLNSLKHKFDEKPLMQLYGSLDLKHRGSILAFNVLDSTGNLFPARLVQKLARRTNIFLDAGHLSDLYMPNLPYPTDNQVEKLNASTQVLRLSLGPVSTFDDIYRLAQFLSRFRDEDYMSSEAAGYAEELENGC